MQYRMLVFESKMCMLMTLLLFLFFYRNIHQSHCHTAMATVPCTVSVIMLCGMLQPIVKAVKVTKQPNIERRQVMS